MQFTTALVAMAVAALTPALAAPTAEANRPAKRFASGWCGLHITQHQKNENGVGSDYTFDVRIHDSIQVTIGGTNGLAIPSLQTSSIASELPNTLDITAGSLDVDPITFGYAGQRWDTSSGQCSIGGYQNGKRDGDCGFTC